MKKYLPISIIILFLVVIFSLAWLSFFKSAGKTTSIEIKSGESTMTVAKELKQKKAIFSSLAFYSYVHGRHLVLQPGVYDLSSNLNMIQMAKKISAGESSEIVVTIPEGYRLTQIDSLLAGKNLIKAGDLIKIASSDEGYLFPDTYRFKKDATAAEILQAMNANFDKRTANLVGGPVTRQDLIIASIVEREAKFDEDRAKIAGVYWSRFDIDMKLQSNPTVEYAKGVWGPITASDIQTLTSKYNTYMYADLPPGPICNPGLKSIEAALNPVKDGSLFFITDSSGHAMFAKTLEQHNLNIKNAK